MMHETNSNSCETADLVHVGENYISVGVIVSWSGYTCKKEARECVECTASGMC